MKTLMLMTMVVVGGCAGRQLNTNDCQSSAGNCSVAYYDSAIDIHSSSAAYKLHFFYGAAPIAGQVIDNRTGDIDRTLNVVFSGESTYCHEWTADSRIEWEMNGTEISASISTACKSGGVVSESLSGTNLFPSLHAN